MNSALAGAALDHASFALPGALELDGAAFAAVALNGATAAVGGGGGGGAGANPFYYVHRRRAA